MTMAQKTLKDSCFGFATTSMPPVPDEEKCKCPAAIEPNQWTRISQGKTADSLFDLFTNLPIDFGLRDMQSSLVTISNLRHTAVH